MTSQVLFILLYSGVLSIGIPCAAQNALCFSSNGPPPLNCTTPPNPTADFLRCVGVPEGPGAGDLHVLNLKGLMEAVLDVYSFMRSSVRGVPVLELFGAVRASWTSLLQNQDFLQFWLEARLTPLLSSVSQQFLTCLSNSDFNCSTYHTVVQQLSQHYSGMDPVRQKWIYMFFMYPFLSRNSSAGCVDPDGTTKDWLIKNFGSFSVLGQIRDFTTINVNFSGLEALNVLTPQQQADLLLNPGLGGVDNASLSVVMDSLLNSVLPPDGGVTLTPNGSMWTADLPIYIPSPQDPVTQVMNGFLTAFSPVRSFVREFVSLSNQPDLSSAMFVQGVLNWTLAELAAPYKENSSEVQNNAVLFDPTDVNAWFTHIVTPVLHRFIPGDIPADIITVFHTLFYVNNGMDENTGAPDLCSVTLEEPACALNNLMQDVVKVLHCADSTNLTLTPQTLETITLQLTTSLNTLLNQLTQTNFSAPDSPFSDIFNRFNNTSPNNLQDELFISTWFQSKLKPRLSQLDQNYLTCLSAKPFSCQTFQIIVKGMSDNMHLIGEHDRLVYIFFITSFLQQQNTKAPCMSNSSSDWILRNLAGFSHLASVQDLYLLNREFNALEALYVLSPRQLAELVVVDLPELPEKSQVIDAVFDFALTAPIERNLTQILGHVVTLAQQMGMNCSSYQQIVKRLYTATVPLEIQKIIQDFINTFTQISPLDCLIPPPATCLSIPLNETLICAGVYSVEQFDPLTLNISCNTSLKQITCSQAVMRLTAEDLASLLTCSLSSNVTYSKELWKLLFIKLNGVLNDALRIFSSRALPWPINSESMSNMLDVIADIRLEPFSPDQWDDTDFMVDVFNHSLKPFLSFASADLLYCFSSKNLSCNTYHMLVKEFSHQMFLLDKVKKLSVLKDFILPYLTKNSTDVGCVSSTNSSSDWLLINFGSFAELLFIRELITINPHFNPMLALPSLTPLQTVELMVEDLPGLSDKSNIINTVFNFLLSSPWKLILVLQELLTFLNKNMIPCSSHAAISSRLFWAPTFVPRDLKNQLFALTTQLENSAPQGCSLTPPPSCPVTTVNESQLCNELSRYSSEQLLQEVSNGSCSISLQNYACSQLEGFNSEDLAFLLSCGTNSPESSNEVWKLLFYKADKLLDQALLIFSNMTGNQPLPRSLVLANILQVIEEVQLDRFTPDQWNDTTFITTFFGRSLRPYLPSVTKGFLLCLVSKNLSCPTFQIILQEFSHYFSYMDMPIILSDFIWPVLHMNSDVGCVSSTNSSSDWLLMNFGLFSELLSIRELITINPHFNPLLALSNLSSSQVAEVMVIDIPGHSKDEVINSVFDFLIKSPVAHRMPAVLSALIRFTEIIPCSSYKLIFTWLQHALLSVPSEVKLAIWSTTDLLLQTAPAGCMPTELQCPVTLVNESEVCSGVDSSGVESFLTTGGSIESLCRLPILNFSCAVLEQLTALQFSNLLQCKLDGNEVSPKDVWKLFFTKVSELLDSALYLLTQNMDSVQGPNVPVILEVIAEVRLNQFTPDQWTSGEPISDWLKSHLKPLLPSVPGVFLYCLSSKNLTCPSYQTILPVFTSMNSSKGELSEMVLKYFIVPILTNNFTGGCVINDSAQWLAVNFGPFSQGITVKDLMNINRNFNPMLALPSLTPLQTAELVVDDFPGLPDKSNIINTVFHFLLESPWERRLPEVLQSVSVLTRKISPNCETYKIIFSRLDMILSSSPGALEPVIWASVYSLLHTVPPGCLVLQENSECLATPFNDTDVCNRIQSSVLNQYVTNGTTKLPCDFTIPEYACAKTLNITSDELVCVLASALMNSSSPAPVSTWKLFLTRVSAHLDSALLSLSRQVTIVNGTQASNFLDALREIRLDRFSADELLDEDFIRQWFGGRLRPLLSHSSDSFLNCISSRNLSCTTFHSIVQVFNDGFSSMDSTQQDLVAHQFIHRFLHGKPEPVCVSNDSVQWLISNFGNFSSLFSINEFISLNPNFRPLEALLYLSVPDVAGLLVFDFPGSPPRDEIINAVFDFLTASPRQHSLTDVLEFLMITFTGGPILNISCSSYRTIFSRLDYLFPGVPVDMESVIVHSKSVLLKHLPAGCVIYRGQCNTTPANETTLCRGVNSEMVFDSLQNDSLLCNFSITQYACTELSVMLPVQLVKVLVCNLHTNITESDETWKLFITKANPILGPALDLLSNTTLPWSPPLVSVLDMIGEVTLSELGSANYRNSSFIQRWFQTRLRPFLPYASPHFLSCLSSKDFSCDSFQNVVQIFSEQYDVLSNNTAVSIYTIFIQNFLNQTTDCAAGLLSSDWLSRYFGPFSNFASLPDLQRLNPSFNPLDVLDRLSLGQLVQVLTSPGVLTNSTQVNLLMGKVPDSQFFLFFTSLASALQQGVVLPGPVRVALLQQVLDRANLAVPESQLQIWFSTNLPPLVSAITPQQIPQFFTFIQNTSCTITQQAVALLNSSSTSFSNDTLLNIYQEIINSLKGPEPLRCYRNQSFYSFLLSSFMGFQFPPLTVLLSIIPTDLQPQLLSSISPAELYSFLSQPDAVDDPTQLCQLFNNYQRIKEYLQDEPVVSPAVGRQTLACVWSGALNASSQEEVDQWFNVRLKNYLPYLSSQLISSTQLSGASCLAFRKFVSVMGTYNYSNAGFTQKDVYTTIQAYLSTDSIPKCYSSTDPELNSTSWFVNYLGFFISFISFDDLEAFGGINLGIFTVDMANLKLFQQYRVNEDVASAYVELLYEVRSSFSATLLPPVLLCLAPPDGFTQLNSSESEMMLESLKTICSSIDPSVSAALAENMGSVSSSSISALGNSSTGLSTGQISTTSPSVLNSSLSVLGSVVGWNRGQTMTIINVLLDSGVFKITGSSSLLQLGTLVTGIPSTVFTSIQPTELLKTVQSQSFLTSITNAPSITQQTIVNQLITLNSSSDGVVNMIPGSMASLIPRNFLLSVSASSADTINKKEWKYEQAMLFFDTVAGAITNEDDVSPKVLQGFTSTRTQSLDVVKVRKLIRGCRRRPNSRIILQEAQLTCMYYFIKSEPTVTNFTDYPPELFLYYNYSLVSPSQCLDFFSALGFADFSVLSSSLSSRKQDLFNSAIQCLNISGTSVSSSQLEVLGNLTCMLNGTFIQNSDPYVLEKLKPCQDFSSEQISAMETVLLTKNTTYSSSNNWNITTLINLGNLPLYFSFNFWGKFLKKDKTQFMKTFLPSLRGNPRLSWRIDSMLNEAQKSSKSKTRLSLRFKRDTACTSGEITQVQANDNSFPFGYDASQFNVCLSVQTLKDNLASISEKAVGSDFQRVILDKLNQAYPSSISDEVLQVLGPASRAATVTDISKWSITKVDTLTALMKSSDGNWTSDKVKVIVSKYLAVKGNSLGSSELNAIGGVNLCNMDISTLNTITAISLQSAGSLSVSTCNQAQQQALFSIAQTAFSDKALKTPRASTTIISPNAYQLIQNYLSGATLAYIQSLAASSISMDLLTFTSLNPTVVNALTVSEVKGLLGTANLPDLKRYESNPVVQNWVRLQLQSDLNALGIGLTGGRANDTSTGATPASATTTANANTATSATTKPTGSGSRMQALPRLQLLVLLSVVMTTLKLMH